MHHPNKNTQPAKARRDDLVVQEMPDEVLVYDLKSHQAHCLNQTAAFVWKHCDGEKTTSEIAILMEKEWRKPVAEDVVWLALKQLSRAELLEERLGPDPGGMRASRRAVLRKLGAAAAMTPLVISIIAPTASAGSSTPAICLSCVKKVGGALPCPQVCAGICGRCFDNAGCGNGSALDCRLCGVCNQIHGGDTTASWVADPTLCNPVPNPVCVQGP
jgi:hypothetical protein